MKPSAAPSQALDQMADARSYGAAGKLTIGQDIRDYCERPFVGDEPVSAAFYQVDLPIPLDLIELNHCSSVACSKGPKSTSPAALATASNEPIRLKRAFDSRSQLCSSGSHRTFDQQRGPRVPYPPGPSLRRFRWFRSRQRLLYLTPPLFAFKTSVWRPTHIILPPSTQSDGLGGD
jgi:hypothetical protein